MYASAVILKIDSENSKKFIEIANNLLFKSIELRVIDNKDKLEVPLKKPKEKEKIYSKITQQKVKKIGTKISHFLKDLI